MIWKRIPDTIYEASEDGDIRRLTKGPNGIGGNILRPVRHPNGYLQLVLSMDGVGNRYWAHVLVCSAFHGPRPTPKHVVSHKNHDKADNRADNLQWSTQRDNLAHSRNDGRFINGTRHYKYRSDVDPEMVKKLVAIGLSHSAIARAFRCCQTLISAIVKDKRFVPIHPENN